jgi:hypothetical protein
MTPWIYQGQGTPTRQDLAAYAAASRAGFTTPMAKEPLDPFPPGWCPTVSPGSLRPMLDVVQATPAAVKAGAPAGPCWWLGLVEGEIRFAHVVDADGAVSIIDVGELTEPYPLTCLDSWDLIEFAEGYTIGRYASQRDAEIGAMSTGKKPTWYGRGVLKGADDQKCQISRWIQYATFNEVYRGLILRYPGEHRDLLFDNMARLRKQWPSKHTLDPGRRCFV